MKRTDNDSITIPGTMPGFNRPTFASRISIIEIFNLNPHRLSLFPFSRSPVFINVLDFIFTPFEHSVPAI